MQAKHFKTAEEMSDYQHDHEVQEALRVQSMNGVERYQWLKANWGKLQNAVSAMYADMPDTPPTARHFATMEEKNEFDREREVEFAFQYAPARLTP